jgi:hypothetical protein
MVDHPVAVADVGCETLYKCCRHKWRKICVHTGTGAALHAAAKTGAYSSCNVPQGDEYFLQLQRQETMTEFCKCPITCCRGATKALNLAAVSSTKSRRARVK